MALQQPQPQNATESWDDDGDLLGNINTLNQSFPNLHKTSYSSRQSIRSESNAADEDWQLPVNPEDQQSTQNAISSAKQAGIPLPQDVPASALLGGSIKRLGKKKSRQALDDDWDADLQLPEGGSGVLQMKPTRRLPSVGSKDQDDFDDWTEGSLGIRNAGTRKAVRDLSSAMSPSMQSCNTFESEEDGLDGLVIPTEPLDLEGFLNKRKAGEVQNQESHQQETRKEAIQLQTSAPPSLPPLDTTKPPSDATATATATAAANDKNEPPKTPVEQQTHYKDDSFDDIDFGPGEIFDPRKRTLNRNIRQTWKPATTSSPVAKPQTTLTFTDKPAATRLPRPVLNPKSSRLEPVYESGATNITRPRPGGPMTTGSQLLKAKRSMPALGSRSGGLSKQPSLPSLQNTFSKPIRSPQAHGRHGSDPNQQAFYQPRPPSRGRIGHPPDTPTRTKRDVAPPSLVREAAAKKTVTRPTRKRNFGDGTELDVFDDLPTSAAKESKYLKQPTMRTAATGGSLRQASVTRLGSRDPATTAQAYATPKSPSKTFHSLPRFAQDTASSRRAREQTLHNTFPSAPLDIPKRRPDSVLANRTTNWPAQVAARTPQASPSALRRERKGPTLINPMGKENARHFEDDAAMKGMQWNSKLMCWEGNENILRSFDNPPPKLRDANMLAAPHAQPETHARGPPSPPRPALITNMAGPSQGIQVVGGMVFDPTRMCWLKMGRGGRAGSVEFNPMSPVSMEEDEDDPFKDIEDLKDEGPLLQGGAGAAGVAATAPRDINFAEQISGMTGMSPAPGFNKSSNAMALDPTPGYGAPTAGVLTPVHEEFDLGPEFIRRQREEEDGWRARVGAWFIDGMMEERERAGEGWKWDIRGIASEVSQ